MRFRPTLQVVDKVRKHAMVHGIQLTLAPKDRLVLNNCQINSVHLDKKSNGVQLGAQKGSVSV